MRPVFLRIEPTFDSSFFGSGAGLVSELEVFELAFFAGAAVAAGLIGLVFGSSTTG